MAIAKRIFLFVITNLLIIATISIILQVLGFDRYTSAYGLDYGQLFIYCLIWGMVGSFISLALSRVMAKWMMGVKVIDPNTTRDPAATELVRTVHQLAKAAGLSTPPQVGIYDSQEVNAFATGPTKNRTLVAVSTGLLRRMNKAELEGVLGHEVGHIANGDMVTMTLVQGVVNAFVMFFARIVAHAVTSAISRDSERSNHMLNFVLIMVFQMVFGLLGMIVVGYFSRKREFAADRDGARLAGRPKMLAALQALQGTTPLVDTEHPTLAAFKISGKPKDLMALMSTHPPLEVRIERLKQMVG